ncbi:MAG: hypothetical protein C4548_16370 [Desulfobacteraceae bacterium]|jgi:hypothetical protein|nr:MAG: hypothetical protein C4548_16370 [Desulfobacteraceae bacterium]
MDFFHAGLPLFVFFFFLALSTPPHPALRVPELIGYAALLTILSAVAVFAGEKPGGGWSAEFILFLAAALRLLFLFQDPELSDDIFRYLFDGMMLLEGANPYAAAPDAVITENPTLTALIPLVNHAHLATIYPPAAQFIFATGAFFGGTLAMKLVLMIMDLAACFLIIRILNQLHLPASRAVLYAWHPLPVIEIAASGHIDAAAVCFLMLALTIALYGVKFSEQNTAGAGIAKRSAGWKGIIIAVTAGACFAAAVLVKWIPLLFLPGVLLMIRGRLRKYWIIGFALTAFAMTAPFWPEIQNSYTILSVYLAHWEFSGFTFRMLRETVGSGYTARLILATCGAIAVGVIYARLFFRDLSWISDKIPAESDEPQRALPVLKSFYAAAFAWLLMSPTLHPWYALYLLCLLPFAPGPAGIVLSWSALLAYRVMIPYHLTGTWMEDDITPLLIIAAPTTAWTVHRLTLWVARR